MISKLIWITLFILITHTHSYAEKYITSPTAQKICSNQILAQKIDGGYTWTLTTRLGQLLLQAERKFGSRDKTWTLLGVEFKTQGQPQVWYPSSGRNARLIAIQLTRNTATNKKRALFQLAHEVIHTLSPAGPGKKSSVFEEGIATYFSIHSLKGSGVTISSRYIASKVYKKAYKLIEELYAKHPDTDQRIKRLRYQGYTFSNIPYDILMQHFPSIDILDARLLTQRFDIFRQSHL